LLGNNFGIVQSVRERERGKGKRWKMMLRECLESWERERRNGKNWDICVKLDCCFDEGTEKLATRTPKKRSF
jgi:hypothetical protein